MAHLKNLKEKSKSNSISKKKPLTVEHTPAYERDLKRLEKKDIDISKMLVVIEDLKNNKILAPKYRDHQLQGKFKDLRECHIEKDWLLIYKKEKNRLILLLVRTGSHDDILR